MTVSLPDTLLAAIHAHAAAAYPLECCGALLGDMGDANRRVLRTEPLDNSEAQSPQRRFAIDGRSLLRVERSARAEGLAVIGFYHSHPDSPARPSPTDREWAWPEYSYLIVSVAAGRIVETRSYRLESELGGAEFDEEEILTI